MSTIIEKILELLQQWIAHLLPFNVMGDDQCGLIRRLGKFHRVMVPGWNWKIPIIEQALCELAALDSTVLPAQSLTTRDGKQVTVRGVITYRVQDPRKYILDCGDAQSVINDVGCCVLAEVIPALTAEEVLHGDEAQKKLLRAVRARGRKWGIDVDYFGIADRVACRTYRFIGSRSGQLPNGS